MAKLPLHIGNGLALLQHETGIRVAQAVGREVKREGRLFEHAPHHFSHLALIHGGAAGRAKHPARHLTPSLLERFGLPRDFEPRERLGQSR